MKKFIEKILALWIVVIPDRFMMLQLFADAGTLTNTTQNYVNSYTGTTEAFSGTNTLAPEMKVFYDTELLENARQEIIYGQFGKVQGLPNNRGSSVEWRKFNAFAKAEALQEGVIPTGQKMGVTFLVGTIGQYGTYVTVSDRLEMRAYDDVILAATEGMGQSMASTQECLIRDALLAGTNVLYCDNVLDDGTVVSTPTSPAEMAAGGSGDATEDGWCRLTGKVVAHAAAIMKRNKVPKFRGKYVAVVHPSVAHDLRQDPAWIEAHKYSATTEIFNGEIGELHGIRFMENADAPVLGGDLYENKEGGVTYATYIFGKDAFGIIDPYNGAAEMIVKDKEQVGGPLNQFSTIGYKLETNGATILYPERLLRLMSCSKLGEEDDPTYEEDAA